MFFAVYDPADGRIVEGLFVPSEALAQSHVVAAYPDKGYSVVEHAEEVDNSCMRVVGGAVVAAVIDLTQAELQIAVNRERARRIMVGATFDGIKVTGSDDDIRNLTNLALGAQLRAATGDASAITFRDGDNVDHQLTPDQVLSLWRQSSAYVSALYAKSWEIKGMDVIPQDVTNDQLWSN